MEFPSQYPDSPAPASRALAGPSRIRHDSSRLARTSSLKPYARPQVPAAALPSSTSSSSSLIPSGIVRSASSKSTSTLTGKRGSTGNDEEEGRRGSGSSSGGGLFSNLRQAIFSKPLSWLQGGASRSDTSGLLKSSSSTSSLPSNEQREAASRLAAARQHHHYAATDPEAHNTTLPTSPRSKLAATPEQFNARMATQRPWQARSAGDLVRSAGRSPSPASVSMTSVSFRPRVAGAAAEGSATPVRGSLFGTPSSLTPGYRRAGSVRREGSVGPSPSIISASQSHNPSHHSYGFGSERRYTQLHSTGSIYGAMTPSKTTPTAAAVSSHYRLPSRSPLARPGQRSSMYATSEVGASPLAAGGSSRPASMYGGSLLGIGARQSVAGSVAGSNASLTPRRKQWSSLKLGPQRMEASEGEELMREYASMRARQQGMHAAGGEEPSSSRAASVLADDIVDEVMRPPKRDAAAMSVDLEEEDAMSSIGGGHKRQKRFVWDADMGFVSRDEQRARRQPPKPVPQNEAERILNVLESMRTPLGDARKDASARSSMTVSSLLPFHHLYHSQADLALFSFWQPSRHMAAIPVPLPVAERSSRAKDFPATKTVAPYSRSIRQNRLTHSLSTAGEADEGMRARLRRSAPAAAFSNKSKSTTRAKKRREEDEMSETSDRQADAESVSMKEEEEGESEEEKDEEEEEEEEEIVEPPRRRSGRTAAKAKTDNVATPDVSGRTLRSTNRVDQGKAVETPTSKAMSKARPRFAVNGSSAAPREQTGPSVEDATKKATKLQEDGRATSSFVGSDLKSASSKSQFSIRSDTQPSDTGAGRGRSSLRQGVEKTSRTHGKSGRISAWDMDDDDDEADDLPGSEDLSKIKLPPTMFPKGFSFGGPASSTAAATTSTKGQSTLSSSAEKAPSASQPQNDKSMEAKEKNGAPFSFQKPQEKKEPEPTESAPSQTGQSLLSRLGGFAPPEASAPPQKDPPPSFSFNAPSTSDKKEATAPLFSTSVSASKPTESNSSPFTFAPAKPGPTTTTASKGSDFFKPPSASESNIASPAPESTPDKSDGPVPNFFASSLAKSSTTTSDSAKSEAPKLPSSNGSASASFSFGAAPKGGEEKKVDSPFSFGAPASTSSTAAAPGPKASTPFSFGQATSSNSTAPTPAFSGFGATTTTSNKRSAEDDTDNVEESSAAKRTATPFGGGGGFSFGQPSPAQDNNAKPGLSSPFTFGPPATDKDKPAASAASAPSAPASTPAFSFGQPAKPAETGDAAKKPMTPAFSFGASAPSQTNSAENSSKEASPAPGASESSNFFSKPPQQQQEQQQQQNAPKPFSFGQPASNSTPQSGPFSSSGFGASKPSAAPASGGFSFGAPASSAAPATSAPAASTAAASPFSFGAANSSTSSNPFGGAATNSSQPQVPSFGAGSDNKAGGSGASSGFSFGQQNAASSSSGTSGPPPTNGSAPSFGVSSPASPFAFGAKTGGFGAAPTTATPNTSQPSTPGFAFGANDGSRPGTPSSAAPQSGFSFGAQPQQQGASGGFNFSMQPSNSSSGGPQGGFGGSGGPSSPSPFVFGQQPGQPQQSLQQQQQQPGGGMSGGFSFGSGGANTPLAPQTPPPASPAGGALFNLGAPPSAGTNASGGGAGGNRPVRSMPKRGPRRG